MTEMTEIKSRFAKAELKKNAHEVMNSLWASLFHSGRTGCKNVLICSADRREGSSTIAAGLALAGTTACSIARVALVDFNLRAPALHEILGISQGPGVGEILLDNADPAAVAQKVNDSLDVFTIGNAQGRALDILRSEKLPKFLESLSSQYQYVLVDMAAVNQFPDAQVLAGTFRDVLLVVYTQQTPREAVAQAKKQLESAGARIAGMVLNQRTYPIPKFLYQRV